MSNATKVQLRQRVRESLTILEEVRREMFLSDKFTSDEVHEVALAQFAVSKVIDKLDPNKR